ncbi:MAG: DUF4124 domain-containing protein [Candidatus Binatia bacterium]
MRFVAAVAVLLLAASAAGAEQIYKWVDEEGRAHFSNRGSEPPAAPPPPPSMGEGWESVLERQEGADEFSRRAEAVINSLNADRLRKRRERDRASATLQSTQSEIVRTQGSSDPTRLPELRAREVKEVSEVRRLEMELAEIDANIDKVKAIKAMGKEQAEKLGGDPFWQFGQ